MSPHTKQLRDRVIDAAIGLLATIFLLFGTGLWNSVEMKATHNSDVAAIRAEAAQDRAENRATLTRILDAVCDRSASAQKPRTCSEPSR